MMKHVRSHHPETLLNRDRQPMEAPHAQVLPVTTEASIEPVAVSEPVEEPLSEPSQEISPFVPPEESMDVSPLSGIEPMESDPSPKRKLVESTQDSVPPSPKHYCCPHCPESFRSYAARQRHVEHDDSESLFGSQSVGDETMNDVFDAMLEQDLSDVEEYFDAEGNVLLNRVFDQEVDHLANGEYRRRANEQVGGRLPLFDFVLRTVGPRRRWLNAVRGAHFHAEVVQHREPTNRDDIGIALAEALYRAILQELENHPRADHVNFNITANGLTHPYQSINLPVAELLERSYRIDQALRTMAGKLNSNEDMYVEDGFLIDLMFVNRPPRAGRPRKRQVGLKNLQKVYMKKDCIVKIENDDNLCVARSIVTMKAYADWKALQEIAKKPGATADQKEEAHQAYNLFNYLTRKRGQQKQGEMARQLHRDAGVPEGACGMEEWKQFQTFLSPEYQLQVLCGVKPFMLLYQGPSAPKQINLIKMNEHMNGCWSYPAFVNKSYWCPDCGRGYDHEDGKNHPCEGRTCKSCDSKQCPDYKMGTQPTDLCQECNGLFYGPTCKQLHVMNKTCDKFKHCPKCSAEYPAKKTHCCYHAACPCFKEVVNVHEHKCFIQPIVDEPEPEEGEEDSDKKKPPLKPLFVYADIEAMSLPDRSFEINLLCYRTSEEEHIHTLWGKEGC